jgi:pilus assembly protein Flp/PilA
MLAGIVRSSIRFLKEEQGPTAVEYAIMLALIIVVCFAIIAVIGSNANDQFGNVALQASVKSSPS